MDNIHWASEGLITSSEGRLLKSTSSKLIIKIIWISISYSSPYEAHLKNPKFAFVKKEKKAVKSQEIIFQNHRNCSLRTSRKGRLFRTFNSYIQYSFSVEGYVTALLTLVRAELHVREASSCDLWNMTSCNFSTAFYSFLTQANVYLLKYAWLGVL